MRARGALAQESPHTAPCTLKRQEHTTDTAARSAQLNTLTHSLTHSLTHESAPAQCTAQALDTRLCTCVGAGVSLLCLLLQGKPGFFPFRSSSSAFLLGRREHEDHGLPPSTSGHRKPSIVAGETSWLRQYCLPFTGLLILFIFFLLVLTDLSSYWTPLQSGRCTSSRPLRVKVSRRYTSALQFSRAFPE